MAFRSFANACRMSHIDEKPLSSIANFIPFIRTRTDASRSSMSTYADSPSTASYISQDEFLPCSDLSESEQMLVKQLAELLGQQAMSPEELGLLYSYRYGVSVDDVLKSWGTANGQLHTFLRSQKYFCFIGDVVKFNHPNEPMPPNAGDDILPTFCNFDDFTSASSDANSDDASNQSSSPRVGSPTAGTCIYSVMMLLNFRASACEDDDADTAPVRYSACDKSDLPVPASPKAKSPTKARVDEPWRATPSGDSWRASPSITEDSWRQALPVSAEDSWVAQQRKRSASNCNENDDENVLRSARSILNKLTVEKFDSLFEQLTTCGIKQPHHISILMREVFEKATTQHHFIPMYAELCVKLEKDPRIASVVEETDQLQNFRRLLLNECQKVFEQVLESHNIEDNDDKQSQMSDEEIAFVRKQRALGNMKLIGELLVHGMLSPDLFTGCCEELLRNHKQCPQALEALVALVMVGGPKFDYRAWQFAQRLEVILADMRALTKDKSVPPRHRFLIRDVLDARDAGWPSSLAHGKQAPTKLEEVRNAVASPRKMSTEEDLSDESPKSNAGTRAKIQSEGFEEAAPWNAKKKNVRFADKDAAQGDAEAPSLGQDAVSAVASAPAPEAFNVVTFRRELASIFSDLASDKNIPAAVQRIRSQQVPTDVQADQFVDILTRIVEERRGAVRRCELAFIVGLSAADPSAFDRKECLAGIGLFFRDVYPELCNEVHRLPAIMKSEFMPTVLNVFPASELNKVVPNAMKK